MIKRTLSIGEVEHEGDLARIESDAQRAGLKIASLEIDRDSYESATLVATGTPEAWARFAKTDSGEMAGLGWGE